MAAEAKGVLAACRPETYRSRSSAFRTTQGSSTPTEILAPSLSTTSRASPSGKRIQPAIHDPFWYGQPMTTPRMGEDAPQLSFAPSSTEGPS